MIGRRLVSCACIGIVILFAGCGSDRVKPQSSCEVSEDALDFGMTLVGDALTRVVTVSNTGTADLNINLTAEGADL